MNSDFSKLSKEERELRFTMLALGELESTEAEEIRQAIAADAELAREFERLNQTIGLVRETAAMDRKVSQDGTPLRLDESRRKKLLETFQAPVPGTKVIKSRRPRSFWFVPMSAAAVLIGLLVVSVTELGTLWPRGEAAHVSAKKTLWSRSATKPYITGTYFADFDSSGTLPRGGEPKERSIVEFASDNDMVGAIVAQDEKLTSGLQRPPSTTRPAKQTSQSLTIALPTPADAAEAKVVQLGEEFRTSAGDLGKMLSGADANAPVPEAAAAPQVSPIVINDTTYSPAATLTVTPARGDAPVTGSDSTVRSASLAKIYKESGLADLSGETLSDKPQEQGRSISAKAAEAADPVAQQNFRTLNQLGQATGIELYNFSTPERRSEQEAVNQSLAGMPVQGGTAAGFGGGGGRGRNSERSAGGGPGSDNGGLAIDAISVDLNRNSSALGLGWGLGNTVFNNQGIVQNGAAKDPNAKVYFRSQFDGDKAGAPQRIDDGAVIYQNGVEVTRGGARISNNEWETAKSSLFNDSSWFGKDEKEKSGADVPRFAISANPTPALNYQWKKDGEKPASIDYLTSAGANSSDSIALLDGSVASTKNDFSAPALVTDGLDSKGELPVMAGDKTFVAKAPLLGREFAPSEPESVTASGFGRSQQSPRTGIAGGYAASSGVGKRLNYTVRPAADRANAEDAYRSKMLLDQDTDTRGTVNGQSSTPAAGVRGFYDDQGTWTASTRGESVGKGNGRVDLQLPAQVKEDPTKRGALATANQPLNETMAEDSYVDGQAAGTSLNIDAAGLPVASYQIEKETRAKQIANAEGIIADKLEKKNLVARTPETGKPMPARPVGGAFTFESMKTDVVAPDAPVAAEVAVRRSSEVEKAQVQARQQSGPQVWFANTSTTLLVTNATSPPANAVEKNVVTVGASNKERAGTEDAKAVRAKPSAPAPTPQPEVLTRDNAVSTFSLNVSDVSFKLAAASLEKGTMPEVANIRSEEFINAFDYRDPMPAPGAPIAFAWERARYPFAHHRDVVRFSVKTAAQGREAGKLLNIVLLLDNSGSMERADRVRIIQESLRTLAAQLKPQDKLSVVTFSRTASLRVDGVSGTNAMEVADKIGGITPEGGTNLEDALDLAYKTALRHYTATAVNRVVLLTDGAANLGNVEPKTLKAKVEGFRKQGVALDCFGIGWEGFNDDLLEQLSRNGDGRYGFVNSPEEAASEFVGQLAGALRVAASDVKIQVEFNPKRVTAWRQIGYAKHQLTKQQFRDNTVDAAEIGAAESGNALYVIETNPNGEGPIATVRARFRIPQTSDYREHEWVVPFGSAVELEQSSPSLRLAASASAFSEWLAGSPFAGEVATDRLLQILSGIPEIYGADPRPKKLEWMIRQAKSISGK